jgi:methionyl-tRNA formyltransferase
MRIVFMGTPEFAVPSLEALLRSDDPIVGVVTQPDRPKGRGQALTPSPIKTLALRHGLPLLQPLKMKAPAFLDALRAWQPELIVVAAFGRILPKIILDLPPKGCINVHGSLLPKYRGAAPIQWAIIKGERETGVTTMLMDEGMDTGAILLQERIAIEPDDTAGSLSPKLAALGGRLLIETVARWKAGSLTPRAQDNSQATLAPILKKEDGLLDWALPAQAIADRVRGLSPWPGAYTYATGERLALWHVRLTDQASEVIPPGTVVTAGKGELLVATGDRLMAVTEVQPANGRRMPVGQYLAGHPLRPGLRLGAAAAAAHPAHD